MNKSIKRLATITNILIAMSTSTAFANCQWTHGSLGQTIQSTSDRLQQYAVCDSKDKCTKLETELQRTVSLMRTASNCSSNVLTAEDQYMIGFFSSRFNIIRKQKATYLGTKAAPVSIAPAPVVASPQTKMVISKEAYSELWEDETIEESAKKMPPNRYSNNQALIHRQAALKKLQQERIIKERQAKHRKQQLIQQDKIRSEQARQQRIQQKLNKERLFQQRLQQQRARLLRWNRVRARQKALERARRQ